MSGVVISGRGLVALEIWLLMRTQVPSPWSTPSTKKFVNKVWASTVGTSIAASRNILVALKCILLVSCIEKRMPRVRDARSTRLGTKGRKGEKTVTTK